MALDKQVCIKLDSNFLTQLFNSIRLPSPASISQENERDSAGLKIRQRLLSPRKRFRATEENAINAFIESELFQVCEAEINGGRTYSNANAKSGIDELRRAA